MGYTHYWTFKKTEKAEVLEKRYQLAIKKATLFIRWYDENVTSLAGYSAKSKKKMYGGIELNGARDQAHEYFSMREHFSQNDSFTFCKTARKNYDAVVVGCLLIFKHYLKDAIDISSDGDQSDWMLGYHLVKDFTRLKTLKPINFNKAA